MQDKFTDPKTKKEFLERIEPVTILGAESVIKGLDLKIKRSVGGLIIEKKFFEDAIAYKKNGTIPERFMND